MNGQNLSTRGAMKTMILRTIGLIFLLSVTSWSQEVIIRDFPSGVGESIDPGIFKPYHSELRAIADSLRKNPKARAIVVGGADGGRYRKDHDAKNPGIALGRAHVLRNVLINEFHFDSSQIFVQTKSTTERGPNHRFVSVRLEAEPVSPPNKLLGEQVQSRPVTTTNPPIQEVAGPSEPSGLQVGVGGSSSPYGGMPVAVGAIVWKQQVYVEGIFGHTIWNETTTHRGARLDIRHRMAGGAVAYFPFKSVPVGLFGGWVRVEEISQKHYSYVRMSEGPLFGLRFMPYRFVSITGAYNPSKERIAGNTTASPYEDHFLLSATIHTLLGGGR